MKPTIITIVAMVLLACNNSDKSADTATKDSTATTLITDSVTTSSDWVPVDSATAMQSMMAAGTPGKEQEILAKANGNWKAEMTMWETPEAAPMKAKGTITNKMILGGRYQSMIYKGDMMGMAFEGNSTIGYDNAKKIWVSTWVDNMSTGIMTMEGVWDDASKSFIYKGEMLCPANGKMCEMKQVFKVIDDNNQVMEFYGPDMKTGKQYKNMEMKLTRG